MVARKGHTPRAHKALTFMRDVTWGFAKFCNDLCKNPLQNPTYIYILLMP